MYANAHLSGFSCLSLRAELKLYEYFNFNQLLRLAFNADLRTTSLINAISEKCPWMDQHIHPAHPLNRFSYIWHHWTLPFPLPNCKFFVYPHNPTYFITLDSGYNIRCETRYFHNAVGTQHDNQQKEYFFELAKRHINDCDCFIYIVPDDINELNEAMEFFLDSVESDKTLAIVRFIGEEEGTMTDFDHNMVTFNSMREDIKDRLINDDVFDWRIWCARGDRRKPTILKEVIQWALSNYLLNSLLSLQGTFELT